MTVRTAIVITMLLTVGCRGRQQHPSAVAGPATKPAAAAVATKGFEDVGHGFAVHYPAGWSVRHDPESVLTVAAKANDPAGAQLSIVVPTLPWHVRGMIPLAAVKSGYVDDLKKRLKAVQVVSDKTVTLPGASSARRFVAGGTDDSGRVRQLDVLLVVRDDTLYIVAGEANGDDFETARAAVDAVESSWRWIDAGSKPQVNADQRR